jgi:hypothetical protein
MHTPESKVDKFIDEAMNLDVSDEFFEAYKIQVAADRDQLQTILRQLGGREEHHSLPAEVQQALKPLSKLGLEQLLRGMRPEQRVDFARLVAGDWW